MRANIRAQLNAGTACVSECVLKTISGKVKRPGNRQFRKLMGFSHGSLRHLSWHQNTVKQAFWVPWSFLRGDLLNPMNRNNRKGGTASLRSRSASRETLRSVHVSRVFSVFSISKWEIDLWRYPPYDYFGWISWTSSCGSCIVCPPWGVGVRVSALLGFKWFFAIFRREAVAAWIRKRGRSNPWVIEFQARLGCWFIPPATSWPLIFLQKEP